MCLLILNSTKSKSRQFSPFFLPYFRHARLPFSTMLRRPLNLKEDSSVAGKLTMANIVLRLAMEKLDNNFEQNAQWHSKNKVFSEYFPTGCKLFVYNSQRNYVSFKLAQKWQGLFICIKHLNNNNILITPLNGNKQLKIHINNFKRAELRDEHLRLNDDYVREQLKQIGNSSSDTSDKLIVPNHVFNDDYTPIPQPKIPNAAPPLSSEPNSADEHSA